MSVRPRLVCHINLPRRLDHIVPIPGRDKDKVSSHNSSDGLNIGKRSTDDNVTDDKSVEVPVNNAFADASKVHAVIMVSKLKVFYDVGLPKNSLSGNVSELRGYLCGEVGL